MFVLQEDYFCARGRQKTSYDTLWHMMILFGVKKSARRCQTAFLNISGSLTKQRFDGEFAAHETRQEKVALFGEVVILYVEIFNLFKERLDNF